MGWRARIGRVFPSEPALRANRPVLMGWRARIGRVFPSEPALRLEQGRDLVAEGAFLHLAAGCARELGPQLEPLGPLERRETCGRDVGGEWPRGSVARRRAG